MKNIYSLKIVLLSITIVFNLSAQTFSFVPLKDNTIYSEGDSSNGKGLYLFTGITNNGEERRALVKFDLSSIPPADSIVTAGFQVQVSKTISGAQLIKLYKLTHDWGEGDSDAKFEEGGGATALPGDVTWKYAFFDTAIWIQEGGDYITDPTDSLEIAGVGSYTFSGEGIAGDIRYWIKNPDQNYGWIIITDNQTTSAKRINSGNNPNNPPLVTIQTISPVTGLSLSEIDFRIFPNPVTGEFFIMNKKNTIPVESIRIYDLNGKEVKTEFSETTSGIRMRLSAGQKGVYIIIINNTYRRKLILL